jgi:peptidyl-prolyl cis-trans isomerase D
MFDLFRSRDKAVRYLLTALLLMVALSMVAYLVPGGTGTGQEEQVVAKIGGEPLTAREVQLSIQSAMRNREAPREMLEHFVPQFIDQMITERALAFEAGRMGFNITDADVAFAIRSLLPNIFGAGQFNKEAYAMFLQQQNLTIPEFEANVRKQLLLTRLRNLALEGIIVSPEEVEQEYRRRSDKVRLEYVAFAADKFKSQVKISPGEIQTHFNQHRQTYQILEKRGFDLLMVDAERLSATVNPTEAQLRRAFEAAKDRYRTPERVRARHILLKTLDKPKEEVAKLEAKANDLLKQIKGGADFAELAKKVSEDPGSAVKGGDLDWISRGQTVPNFENSAFSLKPKELSGVIKTEYGFHIIQVMEKEAAQVKSFEAVRDSFAAELKKQMVNDSIVGVADQVRAALIKAPSQAEEIAKQSNAGFYRVAKAGSGDPIPEVGLSRELDEAVASTAKGGVSPVVAAGAKMVIAVVREIFPARPAELSEVEVQIRSQIEIQKAGDLARQKAVEAEAKIKGGMELKTLAKTYGLEVKTAPEFGRDGAAEGLGSAAYLAEAFTRPVGSVIGPVAVGNLMAFAKITAKVETDMRQLPEQREGIVLALKGKKSRERQDLLDDGILTRLIREGKVKINPAVVKRIVASYRA